MNLQQPLPVYVAVTIKLLLLVLTCVILIAARELLIPLTIALFFSFLLLPVSVRLEKLHVPRILAILISIITAAAVFGVLIYFIYIQVISFGDDLPELRQQLTNKVDRMHQFVAENFNISKTQQTNWLNKKINETAESGDQLAVTLFSMTGSFIASLALIPIYIFFLTYYREKYKTFILMVSPHHEHEKVIEILRKVSRVSQKYLKGIFLDVLILSILNSTGFILLGLKHAILFGVIASILNIIPYIGVLIGSLLPVGMALLTKDSAAYALGAAGVCLVVQFLDNNFITPYVVGSSVSINPLTATLTLVASALLWGISGMILCMPVMGMIKVICDHVPPLKPYGFILGEEKIYNHEDHFAERVFRSLRKKRVS